MTSSKVMRCNCWSVLRLANCFSSSSGAPICAIGPYLPNLTNTVFPDFGSVPRIRSPLRSEEHTSELQSRPHLVCRLLLEKKKKNKYLDRLSAGVAYLVGGAHPVQAGCDEVFLLAPGVHGPGFGQSGVGAGGAQGRCA